MKAGGWKACSNWHTSDQCDALPRVNSTSQVLSFSWTPLDLAEELRHERDAGYLGLSITWLSGRTSINDPAGRILNTVNRVKQNQNLGRLFCLLNRTRVLCVSSSACLWISNQFESFNISPAHGGKLRHKKVQVNFFNCPLILSTWYDTWFLGQKTRMKTPTNM